MLTFQGELPRHIKEKFSYYTKEYTQKPTYSWNPRLLLKIFTVAQEHRANITCSFNLWNRLRFVQADHPTKLKLYLLATKLIFKEHLDEAFETLFSSKIPLVVIARNIKAANLLFAPHDPKISHEDLEQCFLLLDQIPAPKKQKIAEALRSLNFERRLQFLRELGKPEQSKVLEIFALIETTFDTEDFFTRLEIDEIFQILVQIEPLLNVSDSFSKKRLIVQLGFMNSTQRETIVKLCCEFFLDYKLRLPLLIHEIKDRRYELVRADLKALQPLSGEIIDLMNEIKNIPDSKREEVVQLVKERQLIRGQAKLMDFLGSVDLKQGRHILELVKTLNLPPDGYIWGSFALALKKVPSSNRKSYIDLFKKYSINEQLQSFRAELTEIAPDDGIAVLALYKKHFVDGPKPVIQTDVFEFMCGLSLEESEKVYQTHLFIYSITGDSLFNLALMKNFYKLSLRDREAEHTFKRLYAITSNLNDLQQLLFLLENTNQEKRKQALSLVEKYKEVGLFALKKVSIWNVVNLALKYSTKEVIRLVTLAHRYFPKNASFNSIMLEHIHDIKGDSKEFFELIQPLRKFLFPEQFLRLVEYFKKYSTDEIRKIIPLSLPFIESKKRPKDWPKLFDAVRACMGSNKVEVLSTVLPYIPENMLCDDCQLVILEMTKYPNVERFELLELLKPMLFDPEVKIPNLIDSLHKHTLNTFRDLLKRIEGLRKDNFANISVLELFLELSDVDLPELDITIQKANLVLKRFPEIGDKAGILRFVLLYSINELELALELIPQLSKEVTTAFRLGELLKALIGHKDDIRVKLPLMAPLLKGVNKDLWPPIVESFSPVKVADTPRFVADIQFLSRDADKDLVMGYCSTYIGANESCRVNIQERLGEFLSQSNKRWPSHLKQALYISSKTWDFMFPLCKPLLDRFPLNLDLQLKILSKLMGFTPRVIAEVIRHILSLQINTDAVEKIVEALAHTRRKDREEVIELLQMLSPKLNEYDMSEVITTLANISPAIRRPLVTHFLKYCGNIKGSEISLYLQELKSVPDEIRERMLIIIEEFARTGINPKITYISLFKSLPDTQWQEALEVMRNFGGLNFIVIPAILNLSHEERSCLLSFLEKYFWDMPDTNNESKSLVEAVLAIGITRAIELQSYIERICAPETVNYQLRKDSLLTLTDITLAAIEEVLSSDYWKQEHSRGYHRVLILANLAKLSSSDRKKAYETILPCLPLLNGKPEDYLVWLLNEFRKFDSNQYAEVMEVIVALNTHTGKYSSKYLPLYSEFVTAKRNHSPHWDALLMIINQRCRFNDFEESLGKLFTVPSDHVLDTLTLALEYQHHFKTSFLHIIEPLASVGQQRRRNILEQALTITNFSPYGHDIIEIINLLEPLSDEEVCDLTRYAIIFSKSTSSIDFKTIVGSILKVPSAHRAKVMDLIINQPWGFLAFSQRICLTEKIGEIVASNDVEILMKLMPIVKKLQSENSPIVIRILINLAKEERADLIELIDTIIDSVPENHPLVQTIYSHRNKNVKKVLERCSRLFELSDTSQKKADVLEMAMEIIPDERESIIQNTHDLLSPIEGSSFYSQPESVMRTLSSIPIGEREEVLRLTHHYCSKLGYYHVGMFLKAVAQCKRQERSDIVEFVLTEFPYPHGEGITLIVDLIPYSKNERETLIRPLLKRLVNDEDRSHFPANFIRNLSYFPESERQIVSELCLPLFDVFAVGITYAMADLLLVEPKDRMEALNYVKNNSTECSQGFLKSLFLYSAAIKRNSLERIAWVLDYHKTNKQLLNSIVNKIIELMNEYHIDQDHFVAQRAIELKTLLEDASGTLNPYRIYQMLKEMHKSEKILQVTLAPVTINGLSVQVNLENWRKVAAAKPFTIGDLPKNLPQENFKPLFEQLFKRLANLDSATRARIEEIILQKFENSAERVVTLFYKPYIKNLFKVIGSPEMILDPPVFFIHAILQYICDLSDEVKADTLLTPREDALLTACWSIQHCEGGQSDGIRTFFNQIPMHYRLRELIEKPTAEQRLCDVVYESVQSVLHQTFCDLEYFKRLDPEANSAQAPHKTKFLMNLLFRQVGLKHRLSFDPNTNCIHESFLAIPVEVCLAKFFEICTPIRMIQRFQKDIKEYLQKKTICYQDLAYTIENAKEKVQECIILDDTGAPTEVTERGALAILLYNEALKKV